MAESKFRKYIDREGAAKIAALCGVTPRAVESWRYKARRPRPDMAPLIIAASNGELAWQDIYPPKAVAA